MTKTATTIVRTNLERLFDSDSRSQSELGRVADRLYPGRGADQWRKALLRALESGWPPPDVAVAIAEVFGVDLHALYIDGGVSDPDDLWFAEKPALSDRVELVVSLPGRSRARVREVITIGALLGIDDAEYEAWSHAEVERAIGQAHEQWVTEQIESGWSPV